MPTTNETVTVAVLMAFDLVPQGHENDTDWMYENCAAATYALTLDDLPRGGWIGQGYAFEHATPITVPVDSHQARSALHNTQTKRYKPHNNDGGDDPLPAVFVCPDEGGDDVFVLATPFCEEHGGPVITIAVRDSDTNHLETFNRSHCRDLIDLGPVGAIRLARYLLDHATDIIDEHDCDHDGQ